MNRETLTELLTAAQMRAIEEEAIASGHVTGVELMACAGQGVVDAVLAEWPELADGAHRAVVLCGPGNNGGDGFVVARLLKARGRDVEVFLYDDPEKLPPDARANYERWESANECTSQSSSDFFDDMTAFYEAHFQSELVVDAIFGIGLSRAKPHLVFDLSSDFGLLTNGEGRTPYTITLDIPSGLCAESGRPPGDAIEADLTVTFHRPKLGHYLADGPTVCGKLVIADIGL